MKPEAETTAPLAVIGVESARTYFTSSDGKIPFRRRIRRLGFRGVVEKLPPCVVNMEACLSAPLSAGRYTLEHEPRIIPAIYVRPFVKGQKKDHTTMPRPSSKQRCG
jgi:transposase